MEFKLKTCIIIVTYNGMQWIEKCLNSIPTSYKIIVVDNNSTDTTVCFIKDNFTKVHLIEQKENLGFGKANNIGIRYALNQGAEYVFLLNQDAYLENYTISSLIEIHKKNREFGILSPVHLNGDGTKLDASFSSYINQNKELQYDALKGKYTQTIYQLAFVNAAAWLIPKSTFEIVGGFDPIFFHYGEDDNYCQRVQYHHLKVGVVPKIYIKHDRESRKITTKLSKLELLKHQERMYKYKWSNINNEIDNSIKLTKRSQLKLLLISLLKLNFKKIDFILSELKLIKNILPDIYNSRALNKTKGIHYLK